MSGLFTTKLGGFMKKFLSCAAILTVATSLFLTGCASTGTAAGPVSVHPREYTLDLFQRNYPDASNRPDC